MQKKKNNKILRLMSIVLMFTLVSTCLLGGTLAKYVTSADGSDTARVAKWGVTVGALSDPLFETEYATTDTATAGPTILLSVESNDASKVVAPGTSGTAIGFSVTGIPEVACKVEFDFSNLAIAGWTEDVDGDTVEASYEPVLWTLKQNGVTIVDKKEFAALIAGLPVASTVHEPNSDLTSTYGEYEISWEWPFSVSSEKDAKDTFLGNKATAPTITLDFDITVTQVD